MTSRLQNLLFFSSKWVFNVLGENALHGVVRNSKAICAWKLVVTVS